MQMPTANGVYKWLAAGLGLISAYMLTIDSMAEWDWFFVAKGAVAHVAAGVAALAAMKEPEKSPDEKPDES